MILLLLASCGFTTATWRSVDKDLPFEDLWLELGRLGQLHGFPPDLGQTDRGNRVYVSRWREYPAPFRFGRRSRLHAKFTNRGERDKWRLEFYIEEQVIGNLGRGFEAKEEDWKAAGQDLQREEVMMSQLRLFRDNSPSGSAGNGLAIVNRRFDYPEAGTR
ncbi:MAG: hypothetical protein ACYTG5_05390 [Planctomycetota bacterium]|jgi:hypothetical protein